MIPILYEATETAFTTNGIGRLADITRCEVTEERNGIFECEFDYPVTGKWYSSIAEGKIIYCTYDDSGDKEPFVIYRRSAPIDGIVTFNAHHISYRLSNVILKPITASGIAATFTAFTNANNLMTSNPFTFWTDKSTAGTFKTENPVSIRSILAGTEGSVLDVFGTGEYKFEKFVVRLYTTRGSDNNVTIRYGKNLTDLKQEIDAESVYNSVVPYYDSGDTHVYGSLVKRTGTADADVVAVPLDLSSKFSSTVPTVNQLNSAAATFLSSNEPWLAGETLDVDFVALWQTPEYENIAPLERVKLCDTVTVSYPALGIVNAKIKVIRTEYDVLGEKYRKITLGTPKSSFAETILTAAGNMINNDTRNLVSTDVMEAAITAATDLITGGMGGHVVLQYDANGKPQEILIMDTEDTSTAVHVLRMNVNGIGFSSNGINGPYSSAWTLDGSFVADFITAGHLSANRIQGGILTLGGNNNADGQIQMYNASGTLIGDWNVTKLSNQYFSTNIYNEQDWAGNPPDPSRSPLSESFYTVENSWNALPGFSGIVRTYTYNTQTQTWDMTAVRNRMYSWGNNFRFSRAIFPDGGIKFQLSSDDVDNYAHVELRSLGQASPDRNIGFAVYNDQGTLDSSHPLVNQLGLVIASTTRDGFMSAAQVTSLNGKVDKAGDTMTGTLNSRDIITTGTGYGFKLTDGTNEYYAAYDNASNFWIGANGNSGATHRGNTYISTGWNTGSNAANASIYVSVPAARNGGTSASNYAVYHAGNYTSIPAATSSAKGLMTASQYTKLDNCKIGDLLVKSQSITIGNISANSYADSSATSVAETGWTLLGILGYENSARGFYLSGIEVDSANSKITLHARNVTSSQISSASCSVRCLYSKAPATS